MKKLILVVFLLLITPLVSAAKIQGTIYDFTIQRMPNSIIEINTEPIQRYVSTDGKYSLEVPPGKYTIVAKYPATGETQLGDIEEITIEQEGEFNIDLFLLDDLSDLEEYYDDTDIDPDLLDFSEQRIYWEYYSLIGLLILIGLIILYTKFSKKTKKETLVIQEEKKEDLKELPKKILEFIEKEERVTQKDLRKKFPYSEAKISLVIAELEHENKIKKIKKGRGNIIIINQ